MASLLLPLDTVQYTLYQKPRLKSGAFAYLRLCSSCGKNPVGAPQEKIFIPRSVLSVSVFHHFLRSCAYGMLNTYVWYKNTFFSFGLPILLWASRQSFHLIFSAGIFAVRPSFLPAKSHAVPSLFICKRVLDASDCRQLLVKCTQNKNRDCQ